MFVIIISLISFCERTMTRPKSVGISVFKKIFIKIIFFRNARQMTGLKIHGFNSISINSQALASLTLLSVN